MRFSINNLSPLVKFLIGIAFIFIAYLLDDIQGSGFLLGFSEVAGLYLVIHAAIGFYKMYKEKKSNKS
jgi:hypothetical protein